MQSLKQKHWQNIFHVIVNGNLKVQHIIEIKNEMMIINFNVSVKSTICAKNIIVRILAHVFVRIVGM